MSVKGDALLPDGDLCLTGPYFLIEPVAVHTQVNRYIPEAYQTWEQSNIQNSICSHALVPLSIVCYLIFGKLIDSTPKPSFKNLEGFLHINR